MRRTKPYSVWVPDKVSFTRDLQPYFASLIWASAANTIGSDHSLVARTHDLVTMSRGFKPHKNQQ